MCGRFLAGWFDYVFEAIETVDGRRFSDCMDPVVPLYGEKLVYLINRVANAAYRAQAVRSRLLVWMRKRV